MERLNLPINQLRIIFLGTPQFAVASLEKLIEAGAKIVAVVTAPDKPAGRGMHLQPSAVKTCALKYEIPVLQPTNLKDDSFLNNLKSFNADLQVVIAFRMLPEKVWNMPPLGTINLHASLLPNYRGAAPINWAIINGEKETGVTTFLLQHEIDTGDILLQEKIEITENSNAGILHDALMTLGAEVIVNTVKMVANKSITSIPQGQNSTKIAPKIFTENCLINWQKSGKEIIQLILGLSPYPGAFTQINGQTFKIYNAKFEKGTPTTEIELISGKINQLRFSCSDGWIYPLDVQLQGKKRMGIDDLLRGWNPLFKNFKFI